MNRYAPAVLLFLGHAAFLTAVTATSVALTGPSRESHASGHFRAGPVADLLSGSEAAAPLGGLENGPTSSPQGGGPLPRGEQVNCDPPDAAMPPVLARVPAADEPPPDAALARAAAILSPSDDRPAALQQLVAQSRQNGEQLAQIDDQLAALRQQAANVGLQQKREAEQRAARHVATLAALGTLRQAQSLLLTGNSDGVDDDLSNAEAALAGRTRLDVDAAREALARGDLFQAGQYLAAAQAERRGTPP